MKSIVSLSWVLIVTFLAVLSLSLEVVAQKPPRLAS